MVSSLAWLSDEAQEELEREQAAAEGAAPSAPRAPAAGSDTGSILGQPSTAPPRTALNAPVTEEYGQSAAPPPPQPEEAGGSWLDRYAPELEAESADWLAPYEAELQAASEPEPEYFRAPRRQAAPGGGGRPSKDEVFAYLLDSGVPSNHAAGMVSNIQAESNFNPSAIGDNGSSGGLFQHHADRFNRMVSYAGPNWKSNWQGQIDYALSEPDTQRYLSQDFRSPEDASWAFTTQWERPARAEQRAQERLAYLPDSLPDYSIIGQTSAFVPEEGEEPSYDEMQAALFEQWGVEPGAAPVTPEEEPGWFTESIATPISRRYGELSGALTSGAGAALEATQIPGLTDVGEYMRESGEAAKTYYPEAALEHDWEGLKERWGEAGITGKLGAVAPTLGFIAERVPGMLPDMFGAAMALPGYVLARSEEIGTERAKNSGREQADAVDIMSAAPFALASALFERFGAQGITRAGAETLAKEALESGAKNVAKRVAKAGGMAMSMEAGTEAMQEGVIEYLGEKLGTDAALDFWEAADRAAEGAVVGGGLGGAGGTAAAGARELARPGDQAGLGTIGGRTSQDVDTLPETGPDELAAVRAVNDGRKMAGMVTRPEAIEAAEELGLTTIEVENGILVAHPDNAEAVADLEAAGERWRALGYAEDKVAAIRGGATVMVRPVDATGASPGAQVVSPGNVDAAVTAAQQQAGEGGTVEVIPIAEETARRVEYESQIPTGPRPPAEVGQRATGGPETSWEGVVQAGQAQRPAPVLEQPPGQAAQGWEAGVAGRQGRVVDIRRGQAGQAVEGQPVERIASTAGAQQQTLGERYESDRVPDRMAAQSELQEIYAEAYESVYGKAPTQKVLDRIRREVLDTPSPAEMVQNIRDEAQNPDISDQRRALHDAALDEIDIVPYKADLTTPRSLRANPELFADVEALVEGLSAILPNDTKIQQAKQQLADIRRNKALAKPLSVQDALESARGISPAINSSLDDLAESTSTAESLDAVRRLRNGVAAAAKTTIPEARRAEMDARREVARKQQRRRDERRAKRVEASREAVSEAQQEREETASIRERQAERAEKAGVRQADRAKEEAIERSRREGPPPPLNREARKVGAKEWVKTSLTELRNLDPSKRRTMLYLNDLRRIAEKYKAVLKDRGELKAPRYYLPNNKPKDALASVIHAYTLRDVDRKRNIARANDILKEHWTKLKPERRDAVTWAAEQATLHEVNVDKPYTDSVHKHLHDLPNTEGIVRFNQAMAAFNALNADEQTAYRTMRDFMRNQREETLVALARSVLYNSGLAYTKMALGNTPTSMMTRLKSLQATLTAKQVESFLLEDAPPTDRAAVLATLETVQGLLDAQETRGDYWSLRRSGEWVVEASSTYTLADATEAGLKAKVAAAITKNPTLQTYAKAKQQPDGSWSTDIVDRVFELHESREHARARLAELKESKDYESVATEPTRKQDWKPPRDSAAFELFNRLQTRLPDDTRVQTALREVMMAHLMKRDLARGAINRKKVKGYSREFGAAFGDWTLSQASYRGNLALAPVEAKSRDAIKDYADALKHRNDPDAQITYDLLWRLEQQIEQDMRVNSPATRWITKALSDVSMITLLSDIFYSVLNATQTVMFSIPAILGRYGAVDGGKAIAKAAWDLGVDPIHLVGTTGEKVAGIPKGVVDYVKELRSRGTILPEISLAPIAKEQKQKNGKSLILTDRENAVLSSADKQMIHILRQTGLLDVKFADYVEASKAISGESVGDQISKEFNQMLSILRQLPEATEYANRGIVGLATLRLEKARGASDKAAVEVAASMTNSTQFSYEEFNRPLAFRGPVKSNIFRFRMFSIGVAQFAGRVIDGMRGRQETTPFKTKAEARKTAGWFLTMAWMLSGAKGSVLIQPLVWPLMAVAKALGLEEPCLHDPETCVYNFLTETYGEDTADLVMNGPVDFFSGAAVSDRVGLSDLLFFGDVPDVDEHGALDKAIVTLLGPTASLGKDYVTALFGDGEAAERAQTRILPKPIRNVVKAMDLSEEGIKTYSHGRRLAPEDISSRGLFWQGLGVSPTEVSRYWEQKGRLEGTEKFYEDQRKEVRLAYKDALLDVRHNPTDKEARKRALAALKELQVWNQHVLKEKLAPSLVATPKSVVDSVKQELKKEQQVKRCGWLRKPAHFR